MHVFIYEWHRDVKRINGNVSIVSLSLLIINGILMLSCYGYMKVSSTSDNELETS